MSKYAVTGVRKGNAPEGYWEYDIQIAGEEKEKIVVAKNEKEALKKAKKGEFISISAPKRRRLIRKGRKSK